MGWGRWAAGIGMTFALALPVAAATFVDVDAAMLAGDFGLATTIARELDRSEGGDDYYGAWVKARKLALDGRCDEAVLLFDMLALTRPYFIPAHEGAYHCLQSMGLPAEAILRLDGMLAAMPQGPARDVVLATRQSLDASDRPVIDLFAEIAPTSNVERQTAATSLGQYEINEAARGHAGLLARFGGSVTARLWRSEAASVAGVLRGELGFNTADTLLEPRLTAELPISFGGLQDVSFLATPFVSVGFAGLEHSQTRAGLRGVVSVQLTPAMSATLSASSAYAAFPLKSYRDGWEHQAAASLAVLVGSQTMVTTTARGAYNQTNDASRQTIDLSLGLRLDHALDSGLLLALEGEIGRRFHASPPPLSTGSNQTDTYGSVRVEASHRGFTIGPFMPVLYYEYGRQLSDNVFYQHDSHDLGVTLRAKL